MIAHSTKVARDDQRIRQICAFNSLEKRPIFMTDGFRAHHAETLRAFPRAGRALISPPERRRFVRC
jgi:hypothetical protein